MQSQAERQLLTERLLSGSAAALAAGYALTLWIFYPGIMTYDANSSMNILPRAVWVIGNLRP